MEAWKRTHGRDSTGHKHTETTLCSSSSHAAPLAHTVLLNHPPIGTELTLLIDISLVTIWVAFLNDNFLPSSSPQLHFSFLQLPIVAVIHIANYIKVAMIPPTSLKSRPLKPTLRMCENLVATTSYRGCGADCNTTLMSIKSCQNAIDTGTQCMNPKDVHLGNTQSRAQCPNHRDEGYSLR